MTSAALRMHAHRLGWLASMLALFCSTTAQAWGPAAHRIVAQLAEGQLQADARVKVRLLLTLSDARHLSDIANWADDLRRGSRPARVRTRDRTFALCELCRFRLQVRGGSNLREWPMRGGGH